MIEVKVALTILGFIITLGITVAGGLIAYGRLDQKVEDLMKKVLAVEEDLNKKVSEDVFDATIKPMQGTLDQIAKDVRELLFKMGGSKQ